MNVIQDYVLTLNLVENFHKCLKDILIYHLPNTLCWKQFLKSLHVLEDMCKWCPSGDFEQVNLLKIQ